MKFIVGTRNQSQSVFVMDKATVRDLSAVLPAVGADLSALAASPALLEQVPGALEAAPVVAQDEIRPALPITVPGKVICLGLNYVEHIREGGYDIPDYPALFMRGNNSLIPADAPMVVPSVSDKLDFEVELMIVIGQGGRHISESDALKHVFGYTVFNDGSVRDYQKKTHQWTPGKNFDQTGAVGPIVVTQDEVAEAAHGLKIESRINGDIMQSADTSDMLWSVPKVIATISEFATLNPGDLIATGTPPGVGQARTPPRFLRPGDLVEAEIEGIGICSNPIIAEVR